MNITIETVIAENDIFMDKNPTIEPVMGGGVNKSYKVISNDRVFYVRINEPQADYLNLDRELEADACAWAGELGISPVVYTAKRKGDYLITDFF